MPKELVIAASPHETRVAILEDGQLCEIYIEREKEFALVGSIYKGRVTRVLPGMQSAFVDIGLDSDAFLYVGDFFENLEDYDHVVSTVEDKVEKMEMQGGSVFPQPPSGEALAPPAEHETPPAPEAAAPEAAAPEATAEDQPPANLVPDDIGNRAYSQGPPQPLTGQPAGQGSGQRPSSGSYGRQDRPPRFDRGQGQGYGRNDRDQRRGGRGGRWRRGGGGRGGDRRPGQGRDLPPSKYASPRPYTPRPYDHAPYEPPPENYEPVILPGESLAKYKDRIPGSSSTIPSAPPGVSETPSAKPPAEETLTEQLPPSVFAQPVEAPRVEAPEVESGRERASEESPAAPIAIDSSSIDSKVFAEYQAIPEAPPHEAEPPRASTPAAPPVPSAELSDDEVTALAEQLAEARQEEVAAQVGQDESAAIAEEAVEEAAEEDLADAETREASEEIEDAHLTPEDAVALETVEAAAGEPSPEISDAEPVDYADAGEAQPPSERQPSSARISDPQRARFQRPMRRGGRPRGGRHVRQQDFRRPPQRRPQLISEVLKAGQEIIVQIAKEPLGKKGARITSHVALPGRFLVYMPTVNHIGVSRRIASADERSRLRRLVTESKGAFPGGFIVRTAAEGAPDDEIRADVEFLGRTWEKIRTQAEPRKSPALLHRDLNLVERILRDYLSDDYSAIWIDNEEEFSKVVEFVGRFQPKLVGRVKLYTKPAPIFEEFGIQQELDHALRPKVWLKSGGYIVINHTEALVAIDVNTGKYVGRGSTRLEDTIVKTNLEAVKEIIRQIRLRDLGGIIVLDFIDMEERRNREKVLSALEAALRADRAPSKALPFNEFGLVCVTRKRTKQALERVLSQPCPYCTGSGMVKSVPTICYEIQAEARKMAADLEAPTITLRTHPEIAKALKTREAGLIEELEQATRKSVIIQGDPTLHWEQYDIY